MMQDQGFFTTLSHVFDLLCEESDDDVHTAFVILVWSVLETNFFKWFSRDK